MSGQPAGPHGSELSRSTLEKRDLNNNPVSQPPTSKRQNMDDNRFTTSSRSIGAFWTEISAEPAPYNAGYSGHLPSRQVGGVGDERSYARSNVSHPSLIAIVGGASPDAPSQKPSAWEMKTTPRSASPPPCSPPIRLDCDRGLTPRSSSPPSVGHTLQYSPASTAIGGFWSDASAQPAPILTREQGYTGKRPGWRGDTPSTATQRLNASHPCLVAMLGGAAPVVTPRPSSAWEMEVTPRSSAPYPRSPPIRLGCDRGLIPGGEVCSPSPPPSSAPANTPPALDGSEQLIPQGTPTSQYHGMGSPGCYTAASERAWQTSPRSPRTSPLIASHDLLKGDKL